ncbi:MAG: chemotaxis protein CheW [Polyangiaceae bacterium]
MGKEAATPGAVKALIVRVRGGRCALPVQHVIETMRPLPIETIANAPEHVLGLSVVRGQPVPVVDLGGLLAQSGREARSTYGRFVTVRAGARQVALAVESVVGVGSLESGAVHELPPLLSQSSASVSTLGVLDRDLFAVLDATRVLPDGV